MKSSSFYFVVAINGSTVSPTKTPFRIKPTHDPIVDILARDITNLTHAIEELSRDNEYHNAAITNAGKNKFHFEKQQIWTTC